MSNRRAATGGGVEDPLTPQPGPSQPTTGRHVSGPPSKRKAPDEEENESGTSKRTKNSQVIGAANKSKTIKGERKPGGLIINPILPPSIAAPVPSSSSVAPGPPSRPSSAQGSSKPKRKPPDKLNITQGDVTITQESVTAQKGKGKGKEREVVPTRQDLEADEDVRRMNEERERLRVRDAQTHSKSVEFKTPLPLKKSSTSVPRRRQTGFAFGGPPPTPDNEQGMDSTQPIPVRDTPTIDRNRAMRGEPVKRRSSMTMRGKRASSSFEHTGIIPKPHPSVSSSTFHKHIDTELPDAHRMRHLLVWCTARTSASTRRSIPAAPSRPKDTPLPPLTAEGASIFNEVQKLVQEMLTEQRIDTSLSNRMDEDPDNAKVKEHEQNAKNRRREDDFLRHIERCKQEDAAWSASIQSYNARQASVVDALARQRPHDHSVEWVPSDPSDPLYDRELLGAQLARKCKETASRKRGRSPLAMRMAEVENKADRVHSTLHVSDQLTRRTTRHLNKRFEGLAAALAARSQPPVQPGEVSTLASLASANPNPPSATGSGAPPDTLSILRALARTDVERPQREMGDAARRAAREVQRVNATPGRSSIGGAGASERRLTAVAAPTPRKAPGTPRRGGTPRQKSERAEGGGG